MEKLLTGINTYNAQIVLSIIVFFSLIEVISGQLKKTTKNFTDWILEAGGFEVLTMLIRPLNILAVIAIGNTICQT